MKELTGRSNGQPASLDCSGNAGIVAGGDGFGLGKPERRRGKRASNKRKVMLFRDNSLCTDINS